MANKGTLQNQQKYAQNPFLESLKVPVVAKSNHVIATDKAIVNVITGEQEEEAVLLGSRKYVDAENFVKLFVAEVNVFFELGKPTQKMLGYIMKNMEFDDRIHLNQEECLEQIGYSSKVQYFKALGELCEKGFLAKTLHTNVYWLNPKLMFKGDRLLVLREYKKIKKLKDTPNPNQLTIEQAITNFENIG